MFKETKKRTITKSVTWRIAATLNSYFVLEALSGRGTNIYKAIAMNITGFFVFYFFERIWNKVQWGKVKE